MIARPDAVDLVPEQILARLRACWDEGTPFLFCFDGERGLCIELDASAGAAVARLGERWREQLTDDAQGARLQ